ncbi:uncharacterized protein LOC130895082 [Diorhabda carinulata]|uniref:uncharacterized protein LOC130895082 n=1 Tax=Diorhabda carinulata TaxID=1163345 RepID=UPI0025A2BE0D|nr:uncharacterized protein LOC130895082 [Diorhabda carinulata]
MFKSEKGLNSGTISDDFKLLTNYIKIANFFSYGNFFKLTALVLSVIFAAVSYFSYKIGIFDYRDHNPTLKGMTLVLTISNALFLQYFMVSLMARKRKHWDELFDSMHTFENILKTCDYFKIEKIRKLSTGIIFIFLTIFHSIYSIYYFTFQNSQFDNFFVVLGLRGFCTLYLIFVVTFYLTLTHWLDNRYKFMDKYLKIMVTKPGYYLVVRKMIVTVKLAHNIVEKINYLYGGILFSGLTVCVIKILYYFVLALDLNSIPTEIRCINYTAPIIYAIYLVILTMSCNSVEITGYSLIKTCYLVHETASSNIDKEHLMLLVGYIDEWKPIFSACGYYDVNQSSLSSIFSAIITYLIVLIQFNMVLN